MNRRGFLRTTSIYTAGLITLPGLARLKANSFSSGKAELEQHIIDRVEFIEASYYWPRMVGRNGAREVHGQIRTSFVVRIHTNQGASGWGLSRPRAQNTTELIRGKKLTELIDPGNGILAADLADFDIALFDLVGNILKKPVYQLLGANGPRQFPIYSGMIYLDELDEEGRFQGWDRVLDNCEWDYNFGYRQLKAKIGRSGRWYPHAEGLAKDIAIVKLIHDQFQGRQMDILVDANDMYSLDDTIAFLSGVKDVPIYWVEEPFYEELEKGRQLKQWMIQNGYDKTLYADGEARPDYEVLEKMMDEGILDIHLVDIFGYGFSRWIHFNKELISRGILASPHTWGDRLKTNYTVQLAAAQGNIPTIEGVTCLSDDIDYGNYELKDGLISVSNAPGFGMKLLK
jgi:D-galactarolactone cycloisomerase